ncbi:MAG: hypothetical protein JWP35_4667 [Caulobacter sp.]|nr:hypothetical protein [Caulobacter sp.]
MAATARSSTALLNAVTKPKTLSPPHLTSAYQREAVGTIVKATGDGDGSVLRFARVRSSDRVTGLSILNAALAGATGAIVGFYETVDNGGAMVGTGNQLTVSQSIAAATTTKTGILSGLAAADGEKRVWEVLGLAADPGKDYDIAMTLVTAGAVAGAITLFVTYVSGN